MKKLFAGAALAASILVAGSAANAATLLNGSFEDGANPGSFTTLGNNSTAVDSWLVRGAGVDYIGSYWKAKDGVRSIDLSALKGGTIQQTIAVTVGQSYRVSFWLAGNPDGGFDNKLMATSVTGDQTNNFEFLVGPGNTKEDMGWKKYSYVFTAYDPTATLAFNSQTQTPFGPALDNVSISAVPEPATWAMMIIGFTGAGVAIRRRRRDDSVSFA